MSKGVPRVQPAAEAAPTSMEASGSSEGPNPPAPEPSNPPEPVSVPGTSLAQVKDRFIAKWIESCGMEASNQRRAAAIKAWMESHDRAAYLAGRKGVQK